MATQDRLNSLLSEIRKFAKLREWEQFHTPKNLAMAMSVEASEVAEIFQWLTAEQSYRLDKKKRVDLSDELADVYIYLLKIADYYGVDLIKAAEEKLVKTAKKYPIEKSKGIMKKYTEL